MVASSASLIQAAIYAGYGVAGTVLGQPFDLYRPLAGQTPLILANKLTTLPAQMTNAKASGFNFDKGETYEDVLFNALIDGSQIQVGDYLVGATRTYFVSAMPPNEPISCVQCNRVVALVRPSEEVSPIGGAAPGMPSQPGSAGTSWGVSSKPVTGNVQAGEIAIVAGVPVNILGTTGRATGTGELPSDAPGPSRWRIALPASVCPKGSVKDRDVLIDEEGYRYQVSAAVWTAIGYRCEAIRTES